MLDDRVRDVLARLEAEDEADRAAGLPPSERSLPVGPDAGRLLFGGPLREVSGKVVLVMAADSRDEVRELLERDPWQFGAVIRTVSVTTWDWAQEAARRAA